MKELEIFKLEDRVLFEAAAAAEIIDAADASQYDPNAAVSENDRQAQMERDALKNAPPENPADVVTEMTQNVSPEDIAGVNAEIDALINGGMPAAKELVIINGSVVDKDAVIDSLQPGQDVLVLQNGTGLAEINEYLDQSGTEYSAIHLLTHGNEGYISVNGERIDSGNFDAEAWQEIGEHLTENGDILLYSCNTASGVAGKALVNMISDASGADVAASCDISGISGNWVLEYNSGIVETGEVGVDGFTHNLTSYTVDTAEDTVDDTDGVTSLREAIEAANANDGQDEIIFDSALNGQIIKLDNGVLDIEESLTIIGNGTVNTIIDGQGSDSIFSVSTFDDIQLEIAGVTLQNGSAGGNGGAIDITAIGDVSLSLENVTITGSEALYGNGGAVSIYAHGAVELDIVNSTVTGNYALDDGGAVYLQADSFTVNVVNSTVTGNSSNSLNTHTGAGLYLQHSENSTLNILNSIVYGNTNTASGSAADIYVDNQADTEVALNVIHSIYGEITDGADGETFEPAVTTGSTQLDYSSDNTLRVFGTNSPRLQNGVIQVNNQDIAGYSGTLTARDNGGEYLFFDHSGSWKDLGGNSVSAPYATDIIIDDQTGSHRASAKEILGVNEFFVGAVSGKVYLDVAPQSASYKYDGEVKTAEVVYTTAKGTVITPAAVAAFNTVISTAGITTSSKDVGVYKFDSVTTAITHNGSDVTGKFDLDIDQNASIEITKRAVSLISDGDYKVYDGTALTNSTVTVGGDGFAAGEGAVFTVTGTQTNAGTSLNTFTYTLNAGTLAGNYDISTYFGTLEVGKRSVTVTAEPMQHMTYGDAVPVFTYTALNVVTGETLAGELQLISPEFSSSGNLAAGTYVIGQGTLTNANNANYDIEYRGANFQVNTLDLEVSFTVADKIYDGNDTATLTGAVAGNMVSGDDLSVDVSGADAHFADKNAGNGKVVTVYDGLSLLGADAGNYNLVYNYTGTGNISRLDLEVSFTVADKIYDGNDTATLTGAVAGNMVSGDDLSVDVNGADAHFADKNAGNGKVVTVYDGLSLLGADAGNYNLVYNYTGTGNITPKILDVTVDLPTDKIYDGTVDVDANITVNGIVAGDDVQINAQWQYNSPDVEDADTINNTRWDITGEDMGNYQLPDVPYNGTDAQISAADVLITYVTDSPYYYDGSDQSGTVSAYYTDIHGNRVDVPVNWNGQVFAAVGKYDITVTLSDSNYQATNDSAVLYMLPNNPAGGIYSDGLNPEFTGIVPAIQGGLLINGTSPVYGDIYTMSYPELVVHSMLHPGRGMMDGMAGTESFQLTFASGAVQSDVLKYLPMTIDDPVRESSVADFGWVINPAALSSGDELSDSSSDALIQVRGDAPLTVPESLYIDGDAGAERLPWYEDPAQEQALNAVSELPLPEDLPVKSEAFRSEFEKLLEELVQA